MAGTPLYQLEEFTPPVLLGFVRNLLVDPSYRGAEFAPSRTIDDIAFEYLVGAKERPVMASVISWDAEAPIGGRPAAGERMTGELPPMKRKSRISEKEIIRKYYQPRQGSGDVAQAIAGVYDDLARHVRGIQATMEWLTMQGLTEPAIVYDEGGIKILYDFGHPAEQRFNLQTRKDGANGNISANFFGPLWTNHADSTPLTDLQHLQQWHYNRTGVKLTRFLCTAALMTDLCQNAQLKGWTFEQNAPNRPLDPAEVRAALTRFDCPLPDPYDVTVQREKADGTLETVRCTKPEKITLLPAQTVGEQLWGPTAESRVLQGTVYSSQAPGIMGGTYHMDEPPSEWTKAAAVAFPTYPNIGETVQMVVRDPAATALSPVS